MHSHSEIKSNDLSSVIIQQDWKQYTPEQHEVWRTLYQRRMKDLERCASQVYLDGAQAIGLEERWVPDLERVNARLRPRTGWTAVGVPGFLPARLFFQSLAQRRFPTTITVRPADQLDYVPEPDIFHDVFGHVPLHSDPVFADFLQAFGELAQRAQTEDDLERMTRLFWFTVEFGLIREHGEIKVYGSGLVSSHADCQHAMGPDCEQRRFTLQGVFEQDFGIDHIQPVLFVLESFDQLFEAVEEARRSMGKWSAPPK